MIESEKFNLFCETQCIEHKCKTCKASEFVKWYNIRIPSDKVFKNHGWIK